MRDLHWKSHGDDSSWMLSPPFFCRQAGRYQFDGAAAAGSGESGCERTVGESATANAHWRKTSCNVEEFLSLARF